MGGSLLYANVLENNLAFADCGQDWDLQQKNWKKSCMEDLQPMQTINVINHVVNYANLHEATRLQKLHSWRKETTINVE